VSSLGTQLSARALPPPPHAHQVTLIDLVDRLLQGGIVIAGNITLAAADVDLVKIDLRLLIAAIDKVTSR
jgi:hypothetical protein